MDSGFPQDVWPRTGHAGGRAGASFGFSAARRSLFGKRKGRRPFEKDSAGQGAAFPSAGSGKPVSWAKNIAVIAAVLVVAVASLNWDSISGRFRQPGISLWSLEDPDTQLVLDSWYEPVKPGEPARPWSNDISQDMEDNFVLSDEEIPLGLTETFNWTEYKVRQGDTISGIAVRNSLSMGSIIAFNNIKEAWNLQAGRKIRIPNMDGIPYTVQKNDSLSKIAVKMKVPQNAILDANDLASDVIRPGEVLFIPGARMDASEFSSAIRRQTAVRSVNERPMLYPVSGSITSGYGWRLDPVNPKSGVTRFHHAIDLLGSTGDSVKAAMGGTVLNTDNNPTLGNFIILGHGEFQTLYAHLSAFSVATGDEVRQGDEIGKVGNTGYTTNPHLHFEAFRYGKRINPLDLLK
ncbi:MAG: M23 family metallopeptidase [Treponema sp.]|nr:M23 family metallopeptidase [Treponema sp.]